MNQETKTKVDADKQGYLGIRGVSVTQQIASAYDMPQGVYVAEIIDGGGAADSDLQKGDIITAIDGSTISSMDERRRRLKMTATAARRMEAVPAAAPAPAVDRLSPRRWEEIPMEEVR